MSSESDSPHTSLSAQPAPAPHWYMMRVVGARRDICVRQRMDQIGMRHFQPMKYEVVKDRSGRDTVRERPYVGGLFFCYGTEKDVQYEVDLQPSVLQWVYARGRRSYEHIIIPTAEMENFIRVATAVLGNGSNYISYQEAMQYVGHKVRFLSGPLEGATGTITQPKRGKQHFVVTLGTHLAIDVMVSAGSLLEVLD